MHKQRRTYSKEFKQEAIALYRSSGKSMAEIERDLDMSKGLLKQWLRQANERGDEAFPGHGRQPLLEEELRRLRRENDVLRQEREILKKRWGLFQTSLGSVRVHRATSLRLCGGHPVSSPWPKPQWLLRLAAM